MREFESKMKKQLELTPEYAAFEIIREYIQEKNIEVRYGFLEVLKKKALKNSGAVFLEEMQDINSEADLKKTLKKRGITIIGIKNRYDTVTFGITILINNLGKNREALLKEGEIVDSKLAAIKLVAEVFKKRNDFEKFLKHTNRSRESEEKIGHFFLQKYYKLDLNVLGNEYKFQEFLEKQKMLPVCDKILDETKIYIGKILKNRENLSDVVEYIVAKK